MRGLATGGAGYIGSHAARTLQRRGHEVILYDNLSTGHAQLARGLELVVGDVGDLPKLKPALERVDAVMHFAAHAYVGEPVTDPRKYFHNKVQAGLSLLNAIFESGVRLFIFSFSCAVYGLPEQVPITEDQPRTQLIPMEPRSLLSNTPWRPMGERTPCALPACVTSRLIPECGRDRRQ